MRRASRCIGRRRHGFTLVEVLLAMVLSTALLAGLWAALEISLRMFESGRTRVEEAQLARALLNQLDRDLRQVVAPPESEGEGQVLLPAAPVDGTPSGDSPESSAPPATRREGASLAGILPIPSGLDSIPMRGESVVSGGQLPPNRRKPGLFGSAYELRIDVCRVLPRRVQEQPSDRVDVAPMVPELRTVYYVLARALPAERRVVGATSYEGEGLVRFETAWLDSPQEMERAKPAQVDSTPQDALFEEFLALEDRFEQSQRDTVEAVIPFRPSEDFAVSPEVLGLEFRYFDGREWLSSWDSDAEGALPVAVEFALAIQPALSSRQHGRDTESEPPSEDAEKAPLPVARLVTQLPLGRMIESGELGEIPESFGTPPLDSSSQPLDLSGRPLDALPGGQP